jgi:CheY-like chemotaxis protein
MLVKILAVEDDPQTLRLVCWQLQGFGYDVVEARSAIEALQILSMDDDTFNLLFTDVVLKDEINGIELARRARRAFGPHLKVLLTSGYLQEELVRQFGPLDEDMPLLLKPYTLQELAEVLSRRLGSHV